MVKFKRFDWIQESNHIHTAITPLGKFTVIKVRHGWAFGDYPDSVCEISGSRFIDHYEDIDQIKNTAYELYSLYLNSLIEEE